MASKLGVVLGVVAIILAVVGMAGPWWTESFSASALGITVNGNADFGLFGVTTTTATGHSNTTNSSSYNDSPHVGSVFSLGMVLLILGVVLGIGMVGLAVMPNPRFRKFAAILGVLAFLFALLAPIYVMSALPDAVNTDSGSTSSFTTVSGFWGAKSSSVFGFSASVSWGAGWDWFIPLVAAVLFLVGAIVILAARKPAMATPVPPPTP